MTSTRYAVSWSGGKDSALAMWRAWQTYGPATALITTLIDDGSRSRAHALRPEVLRAQAAAIGVPAIQLATSLPDYAATFSDCLLRLRNEQGLTSVVFGDIDLEAHRSWFRALCSRIDLACLHPIWEEPRESLLAEFLAAGFTTRLVAVQEGKLDPALLGRVLDEELLQEFARAGIDLCGENGEYHTLVTDGPCFSSPLQVRPGAQELREGYWFLDFALS